MREWQAHGRVEVADGGEFAGPADLNLDPGESRERLLGRELVGDHPARRLPCERQCADHQSGRDHSRARLAD